MSTTIYYFSGTGNSLKVARSISESIEDCKLIPIAQEFNKNSIKCNSNSVGFVFPIYFSGLPQIVYKFIKKLELDKTEYIFAIITRGVSIRGAAFYQIKKLLKEKSIVPSAIYFITMVANNITKYNIPTPKKEQKINERANIKIEEITRLIKNQETSRNRIIPFPIFSIMNKNFRKRVNKSDKEFRVNNDCNSCAICAKVCPVKNIILVNGKPKWNQRCQGCLSCIHLCPQKAIQFGKSTEKRSRYHHKDITIKDIIKQNSSSDETLKNPI